MASRRGQSSEVDRCGRGREEDLVGAVVSLEVQPVAEAFAVALRHDHFLVIARPRHMGLA
jgi:hypothetical protein